MNPQTLGATIENLVTQATLCPYLCCLFAVLMKLTVT